MKEIKDIEQKDDHLLITTNTKEIKVYRYNFRNYIDKKEAEKYNLISEGKDMVAPISKCLGDIADDYFSIVLTGVTFPTRASGASRQELISSLKVGDNYAGYLKLHPETESNEITKHDPLAVSIHWGDEDIGFIPSRNREMQKMLHLDVEKNGRLKNHFIVGWKVHGGELDENTEKNIGIKIYIAYFNVFPIELSCLCNPQIPTF